MKTINNKGFVNLVRDIEDLAIFNEDHIDLGYFDGDHFEIMVEHDSLGGRTVWLTIDKSKKTMCDLDTMYIIDIAMIFWTYMNA